jgi:hypothetical protein
MTSEPTMPDWKPMAEGWTAERAEHAFVPGYELIVMQLAAEPSKGWVAEISWEVFGGPKLEDQLFTGVTATFEEAKAQAEAAWRRVIGEGE